MANIDVYTYQIYSRMLLWQYNEHYSVMCTNYFGSVYHLNLILD